MAESNASTSIPSLVASNGHDDPAARRMEDRLRFAIEGAELGTWDWDLASGELVCSDRCLTLFGIEPAVAMSYERFLAAIHPEDRDAVDLAVRRSLDLGIAYHVEARAVWPDGSVHWIESRGRRFQDDAGRPVRMSGVAFEITGRKRTEEELRRNEDRLLLAIEAADLGTWDLDLITGKAVRSLRHDRIFGYEELQSEWNLEVALRHIIPEDREKVLQAHTPAPGKASMSVEARIRRSDGSLGWIVSSGRFHYDPSGRAIRLAGVVADVSDRKRAEEALRDSEQRLRFVIEGSGGADWAIAVDPANRGDLTARSLHESATETLHRL